MIKRFTNTNVCPQLLVHTYMKEIYQPADFTFGPLIRLPRLASDARSFCKQPATPHATCSESSITPPQFNPAAPVNAFDNEEISTSGLTANDKTKLRGDKID